jgi:hypothetical protein
MTTTSYHMRRTNLTSWHFARPELAQHHLRAFELGLISATALHARRRMASCPRFAPDFGRH